MRALRKFEEVCIHQYREHLAKKNPRICKLYINQYNIKLPK